MSILKGVHQTARSPEIPIDVGLNPSGCILIGLGCNPL